MEPGIFTEIVNTIIPYVTDFSNAVGVFLYDVLLRLLGVLYVIARLTPTRWDDRILGSLMRRIRGTREGDK